MTAATDTPLTAMLARAIVASGQQVLTEDQRASVRHIVVDWLGVALAGCAEPVSQIVLGEFANDSGPASIVGSLRRASIADAALINGTIGHALDYDDVQEFVGHPGAVIVPAALALAEATDASGEQLERAIVAGYDAARLVGTLAMPGHYDNGFHSTGTICAFGAAAAGAVLLGLDEVQTIVALGLAGTQAAGLKVMFGTMAKPFHAGRAAAAGVTAARLAQRGMSASGAVLEGPQGFLATQACQPVPNGWMPPVFGESLEHLLFKFHAACYLSHSSIEALSGLVAEHSLTPDDIAAISLHVPAGHLQVCNNPAPATGMESKFSLHHVAAMIVSGIDTGAITSFTDNGAVNAGLAELRSRVWVHGDHAGTFDARVQILLADGQRLEAHHDVTATRFERHELDTRLDSKFLGLAGPVIGRAAAKALLKASYHLNEGAAARLMPW